MKADKGSRYRVYAWYDVSGTELQGYGLEEKRKGAVRFRKILVDGELFPFKTVEEAKLFCKQLNKEAKETT